MNKISQLVSVTALIVGCSGAVQLSATSAAEVVLSDPTTAITGQNGYQLKAENSKPENSQDEGAIYKLYYKNTKDDQEAPVNTKLTLQGDNKFRIKLYKGNAEGNTEQAELFAANNDVSKLFTIMTMSLTGLGETKWEGDIVNRGQSVMHFLFHLEATGATVLDWRPSSATDPEKYIDDTQYLVRRNSGVSDETTFHVKIDSHTSLDSNPFRIAEFSSLTISTGTKVSTANLAFAKHNTHPGVLNYRITALETADGGNSYPLLELDSGQTQSEQRPIVIRSLNVYVDESLLASMDERDSNNQPFRAVLLTSGLDRGICFAELDGAAPESCPERNYLLKQDNFLQDREARLVVEKNVGQPGMRLVLKSDDVSSDATELPEDLFSISKLRDREKISPLVEDNQISRSLYIKHLLSAGNPANQYLDNPSAFTTEVTTSGYVEWMKINKRTIDHKIEFKLADGGDFGEVLIGCDMRVCYAAGGPDIGRSRDSKRGAFYLAEGAVLSVGSGVRIVSYANLKLFGSSKIEIKLDRTKDPLRTDRNGVPGDMLQYPKIKIVGEYPLPANLLEKIKVSFENPATKDTLIPGYRSSDKLILIEYSRNERELDPDNLVVSRRMNFNSDARNDLLLYIEEVGTLTSVMLAANCQEIGGWLATWQESATERGFYFKSTISENFRTELQAAGSSIQDIIDSLEAEKTYVFKPETAVNEALVKMDDIRYLLRDNIKKLINALSPRDMLKAYDIILHHTKTGDEDATITINGYRVAGKEAEEKKRLLFKSDANLRYIDIRDSVGNVELKKVRDISIGQAVSPATAENEFIGKVSWGVGLTAEERAMKVNQPHLMIKNSKVSFEKTAENSNFLQTLKVEADAELIFANLESGLLVSRGDPKNRDITIEDINSLRVENEAKALIGKLLEGRFRYPNRAISVASFVNDDQGATVYKSDQGYLYLTAKDENKNRSLYFIKDAFATLDTITEPNSETGDDEEKNVLHFNQRLDFSEPEQATEDCKQALLDFRQFLLHAINSVDEIYIGDRNTEEFALLKPAKSSYQDDITTSYKFLATLVDKVSADSAGATLLPIIFALPTGETSYEIDGLAVATSPAFAGEDTEALKNWLAARDLISFSDRTENLVLTLGNIDAGNLALEAREIILTLKQFTGTLAVRADKLTVNQEFAAAANLNEVLFTLAIASESSEPEVELTIVAQGNLSWNGIWKGRRATDDGQIDYKLTFARKPEATSEPIVTYGADAALQVTAGGSIMIKSGIDLTTVAELRFLPGSKLIFEVANPNSYGQLFVTGEEAPGLNGEIEVVFTGNQADLAAISHPLELIVLHDTTREFADNVPLPTLTSPSLKGASLAFNSARDRLQLLLHDAAIVEPTDDLAPSPAQAEAAAMKNQLLVNALLTNLPSIATSAINAGGYGQVDWLFVNMNNSNENIAVSQNYNLQGGSNFQQFSGKAVAFFNRLSLYTTKTTTTNDKTTTTKVANADNLAGLLVKLDYLTPVAGLSAGGYLGGAVTLSDKTSGVVLAGFNLDYAVAFEKLVNIQLAAAANLDFLPVMTKHDDDLKTEFHFRGQVGGSFAVDSNNLLEMVKVVMIIPLQFAINGQVERDTTPTYSHSLQFTSGVTAAVEVAEMFSIKAGYKFQLGQKFSSHGLVFALEYSY